MNKKTIAAKLTRAQKSKEKFIAKLNALRAAATPLAINDQSKIVIYSDLHLGTGNRMDDSGHNINLIISSLRQYYYVRGHTLILNGDVEEIERYAYAKILAAHKKTYAAFDKFKLAQRLYKIIGNHDPRNKQNGRYQLHDALDLTYANRHILIFHGHQADKLNSKPNLLTKSGMVALNLARKKNVVFPQKSQYRLKFEENIYEFALKNQLLAINAHSHRRVFPAKPGDFNYGDKPCLFNSGCCIGKHGINVIEIENGYISLIQFQDPGKSRSKVPSEFLSREETGDYVRFVLRRIKLADVFARI